MEKGLHQQTVASNHGTRRNFSIGASNRDPLGQSDATLDLTDPTFLGDSLSTDGLSQIDLLVARN